MLDCTEAERTGRLHGRFATGQADTASSQNGWGQRPVRIDPQAQSVPTPGQTAWTLGRGGRSTDNVHGAPAHSTGCTERCSSLIGWLFLLGDIGPRGTPRPCGDAKPGDEGGLRDVSLPAPSARPQTPLVIYTDAGLRPSRDEMRTSKTQSRPLCACGGERKEITAAWPAFYGLLDESIWNA